MKHQIDCYRTFNGNRYTNYADLIFIDESENERIIKEAKQLYKSVRKVKHPEGYYQLFVFDLREVAK